MHHDESLRPCIFVQTTGALSETFVRRHITYLNRSDTVVLSENRGDSSAAMESNSGGLWNIHPILANNAWLRRLARLTSREFRPTAVGKALWWAAAGRNVDWRRIDYCLFEFGYLLGRHWDFALYSGKPFYVYFRGQDASRLLRQEHYVRALQRLLPRASGVVAVSKSLLDNLERSGIDLPQYQVIASGVDTSLCSPAAKDWGLYASVGRFVEKKAHDDTLRAFAQVAERFPEARLSLIGDGPLLDDTRRLCAELNLAERVTFHGALPHQEVCAIVSRAGYYLQSSKTAADGDEEGFPSAIQEALAAGCVVACTTHAGASHFLDHRTTALLNCEGDYRAMAENLLDLGEVSGLRETISQNARRLAVESFDQMISIKRFEDFVRKTISEPTKGRSAV